MRQKVVPLGTTVERYGNSAPSGGRRFDVTVAIEGYELSAPPAPLTEYFAPGEFQDLSEDEKLRLPSFVQMAAGYQFEDASYAYDESLEIASVVEYERIPLTVEPVPA